MEKQKSSEIVFNQQEMSLHLEPNGFQTFYSHELFKL